MIKTAILAQKRQIDDKAFLEVLGDEGQSLTFQLSYIVSLVGTGEELPGNLLVLVSTSGLAMVKFLRAGPCRIMIGDNKAHK